MLDFLAALNGYAAVISALSASVSTGFVIWATCFRKTRREIVDDLKFAIRLLLLKEERDWIIYGQTSEVLEKLEHKFQKKNTKSYTILLSWNW